MIRNRLKFLPIGHQRTAKKASLHQVSVNWQGEPLVVWYDVQGYTPAVQSLIRAGREAQTLEVGAKALVGSLLGLLRRWSLTDHGQPAPISEGVLETLPLDLLIAIVRTIGEDCSKRHSVANKS